MLEKLYKEGYLDYKAIILDNYQKLNLNEKEAFVMIKILDKFLEKQNIKTNEIVNATNINKDEIQIILYKLSELGYYATYFEFISNECEDEFYSVSPFFKKLEQILNKVEETYDESEMKNIIITIESKLCRQLTPNEFNTINSWLKENYTFNDINSVINDFSPDSIINFKKIERQLVKFKRLTTKSTDEVVFDFNINKL